MEGRPLSTSSNATSMSNLRQIFNPRAGKDKARLPPALQQAIDLLNLRDLDGLEHHFLGTIAFLKPWSNFRDSFLLLQPGNEPRASGIDKLRAVDILKFYTNFSDGELRYDPHADDATSLFTTDETKYGHFDTTHWGVEEYEKMMYAWLLQEFKVGKARNPFGFDYFELLNVCTAWKTVFVPIVEAVRASYDPRGRRYYGRLAKFIEEKHPSRMAFPEGNVAVPLSATPYRVVSVARERGVAVSLERLTARSSFANSTLGQKITRRQQVSVDKELREFYPKYGQVVEKPKWRPAEFLASQKAKMKLRNRDKQDTKGSLLGRIRSGRESPMFGCQGVDDSRALDPVVDAIRRSGSMGGRSSLDGSSLPGTPKKKVLVPVGMYGFVASPEKDKSPLHGVTRRLSLPGEDSEGETQGMVSYLTENKQDAYGAPNKETPRMRLKADVARPETERTASDGVYSSIRNSNPFIEDTPEKSLSVEVFSPMNGHPSAVPKSLFNATTRSELRQPKNKAVFEESSPDSKASRNPSYAGTGYEREFMPVHIANQLHSRSEYNAFGNPSRDTSFMLSPIPDIEKSYEGEGSEIPRAIPWPGFTPAYSPDPVNWPFQTPSPVSPAPTEWPRASRIEHTIPEPPPPIPPKHPARALSGRLSSGSDMLPPPSMPRLLGPRIVSKENIRAHLGHISRDISEESLQIVKQQDVEAKSTTKLTAYNKHLFPRRPDRKGTPVGEWMQKTHGEQSDGPEMKTSEEESEKKDQQ